MKTFKLLSLLFILILLLCACTFPDNNTTESKRKPTPTHTESVSVVTPSYPIKVLYTLKYVQLDYSVDYSYDYRGHITAEHEKGLDYNGSVTYEYNDSGVLISKTESLYRMDITHKYTYDENGFLVKEKVTEKTSGKGSSSTSYTVSYTNDSEGRCTTRSGDGTDRKYKYDDEGRLVSEEEYSNGELLRTKTYKHNADGTVEVNYEGERFLLEYDADGDIIRESKYNSDGSLTTQKEYLYWYIVKGNEDEVYYSDIPDAEVE